MDHDTPTEPEPVLEPDPGDSPLVQFAEEELDIAGLGDEDADYNGALKGAVLDIIKVFSAQGHSGFSAGMVTAIVTKLMSYEPLTPLTGEDSEWTVLDYDSSHMHAQNRRCSHVFKQQDGTAYDSEAVIFRDADGEAAFTSRGSSRPITFPYVPTREYVTVDASNEHLVHTDHLA